jgi:hypothetical protein
MAQTGQYAGGKQHHRSPLVRIFETGWLVFPLVLLAAAYFVPVLQVKVPAFPQENAADLPWALLGMTVAAVIWLIVDFIVVSDLRTPLGSLRLNAWVSVVLALALSAYGGWSLHGDGLTWGYVIPWIASILDAFITVDRAINNAAQKPLIEMRS